MRKIYEGELKSRKTQATEAWRRNNPQKALYKSRQSQAKFHGVEWALTYEQYLLLLEPMTCAVSGLPLSFEDSKHGPWLPSLDRIKPTQGYISGNIRVVCWLYNRAKHIGTDEDVMTLARALVEGG